MTETGARNLPDGSAHANRLIHETSPYLLQHARNPVDWYPWGPEALARAKAEAKPILLSIGYSSCHWCHVMERESFENARIAALMNRHFVCVKVDREERPDLDEIYMAATQVLNQGQGGWPMTVFLTPDGQPFFAGTYFPPTDRLGRPGFATLLAQLAKLWDAERDQVVAHAAALTEHLGKGAQALAGGSVGEAEIRTLVEELRTSFDATYGGFTPPPKFPPTASLALLLRAHQKSGDPELLRMVVTTLDGMAQGGIYDQIGGGFARYATDERWLVPHFEKMLYDNALLARAYLEGYQATENAFYARIARETLDYILREMTGPEGGFFSATDADSEDEEGKFFVWTPAEVEAVLGPDEAGVLCAYYDITEEGNWEGKSIPHTPRSPERVAARLGVPPAAFAERLEAGRARLYEARQQRVAPGLDDKVLTAWNGLMLGAMAEGARVLGEPRYLAAACRAADFLLGAMRRPDGGLFRTWRGGTAHLSAYLEDYAFLAEGLLDLFEAGGSVHYLEEARRLAERILQDFADPAGGFYETAHDHEPLLFRHRRGTDSALPSANATAAAVLARLSFHLDRPDWREAAVQAVQAYARPMGQYPRGFAKALLVTDFLLEGPVELALVGTPGEAGYEALRAEVARRFFPRRLLAHRDPAAGPASDLPLLAGKGLVGGKAALYVCRGFACQAPITEPEWLDRALRRRPESGPGPARTRLTSARPGRATAEGTAARAARFATAGVSHGFGPLGTTGLTVSRLGFGGYRVDEETPEHREALVAALTGGCTLIDTSTNYTDGASESLVGSTLAELARDGRLPREEVVVVSKIGYVQGQNLALAMEREKAGTPFPEMVKVMEGCWHCLHPDWLADQLTRSLERLQLETLDVCLLHNPEYFLADAKARRERDLEAVRREFSRRLTEAFRYLETQVAAGRVGWYGVSSNAAVRPPDDPEATSLSRMLDAARAAGGADHHFRVVQMPLNLLEPGAATRPNTGPDGTRTPLEAASEAGIAVLLNRPLNAYRGERLVRLADFPDDVEPDAPSLAEALRDVAGLEEEFRRAIAVHLEPAEGVPPPVEWFRWADQLRAMQDRIQGLDHWQEIEAHLITPAVASLVPMLDEALSGGMEPLWAAWRERYLPTLDRLLQAMTLRAIQTSQALSNQVTAAVNPHLPLARRGESLSRKALWVLASTPGVTTVLLGMRHPDYVEDGLEVLRWAPLADVRKVYDALAAARMG